MSISITRFAGLSIGAAIVTIILKTSAYLLTGSVGLLSDAVESAVNLVAAVTTLIMIKIAFRPPDEDHSYGHTKAEYFSSVFEGILIILAAISIGFAAIDRLFHPKVVDQVFIGLVISIAASFVNFIVSKTLFNASKKHHSIALEANARHLMTDVWTSVGVVIAVIAVAFTGLTFLDPLIALFVAANIIYSGFKLIWQSAAGFMDTAIPQEERNTIKDVLDKFCKKGVQYHGMRTRQSGARRFVSVHILVPNKWTVQKGHDLLEDIEKDIRNVIPNITVFTHIEPVEDSTSFEDISIDRR